MNVPANSRIKRIKIAGLLLTAFLGLEARAYADSENLEEELRKANALIKRYPGSWEGYYKRGSVYKEADKRENAIEDYSKALELEKGNGSVYLARAEMYLMTTRHKDALADCDAAIKLFPKWSAAYNKRARANNSVEDFLAAKNDLELALSLTPSDDNQLNSLALAYDNLGNHSKAIENATKAVTLCSVGAQGSLYYNLQNRALYWTNAHEYQRAYQDISESLMAKPKNSQVWAYLAYALAMDNKMEKAKIAMKICGSLDTFTPRANRLEAEMYRAGGDWASALKYYKWSTGLEPTYGPGFSQKAMAELALGQYAEAEEDLLKATTILPNSVLAFSLLSLAEDQQDKIDKAKETIDKAIAMNPDFAMNYVVRARNNMHAGDYIKAAEDCNQALKLDPFSGEAYATASMALEKCGKHEEASKFMEKAKLMGWKDMAKEYQAAPPKDATTAISINMAPVPDLAAIMKEAEKSVGEASPY